MSRSPSPDGPLTALSSVNRFLVTPYDMNPSTCDRASYTRGLCAPPLLASSAPAWLMIVLRTRALYRALAFHPAMEPNLSQTFSTPANSKNKVYFMWDFVGRTLHAVYRVPSSLKDMNEEENDTMTDVLTRSMLTVHLLKDVKPGKLNAQVESCYPAQKGNHPELGEDVLAATQALDDILEGLPKVIHKVTPEGPDDELRGSPANVRSMPVT